MIGYKRAFGTAVLVGVAAWNTAGRQLPSFPSSDDDEQVEPASHTKKADTVRLYKATRPLADLLDKESKQTRAKLSAYFEAQRAAVAWKSDRNPLKKLSQLRKASEYASDLGWQDTEAGGLAYLAAVDQLLRDELGEKDVALDEAMRGKADAAFSALRDAAKGN